MVDTWTADRLNSFYMWQGVLLVLTLLLIIAVMIGGFFIDELWRKVKDSVSEETYNTLLDEHKQLKESVVTLQECTNYSDSTGDLAHDIVSQPTFFYKLIEQIKENPQLREQLNAALAWDQTDETGGDRETSETEGTETLQ